MEMALSPCRTFRCRADQTLLLRGPSGHGQPRECRQIPFLLSREDLSSGMGLLFRTRDQALSETPCHRLRRPQELRRDHLPPKVNRRILSCSPSCCESYIFVLALFHLISKRRFSNGSAWLLVLFGPRPF